MTLLKGVVPGLFDARGLSLREGAWLDGSTRGVVLGFEAAELMQRHVGDPILVPHGEANVELPVLGILERTGSQLDGSILLDLVRLQYAEGGAPAQLFVQAGGATFEVVGTGRIPGKDTRRPIAIPNIIGVRERPSEP